MPQNGPDTCDATVAICTCDRADTLRKTLVSLGGLRGPYSFEVLVVNGPSVDHTVEVVSEFPSVRLLSNPERNLSVSRNIAIANAAGRFVAFIDDDAIPEPDWLSLLIARLEDDPEIGAAGGFIRGGNGIAFQDKYVFADALGETVKGATPEIVALPGRVRTYYPSLTGTNVVFRKSALSQVNGFDEVFAYFLDETDVNKRMSDQGIKAEVVPEAEVHHKLAPSHLRAEGNVAKNMYPTARSITYFALRHGPKELGWPTALGRVKKLYADELKWKSNTVAHGHITSDQFDDLMSQTLHGIADGIAQCFDPGRAQAARDRVEKHRIAQPPTVRTMRAEEETLRICMLSRDHAHARPGGIGRWSRSVAAGLAGRGHEMTLIGEVPHRDEESSIDFTAEAWWSHRVNVHRDARLLEADCLGLPDSLADASTLKLLEVERVMPRRRFQVVSSPIWDVEGAAIIAKGAVPSVLSLHTSAAQMLQFNPQWADDPQFYFNHYLKVASAERLAIQRCDMLLANSVAILKSLSELYGIDLFARPHRVIPHGVPDIAEPEGLLDARIERRAQADPGSAPLNILFVGRLEKRKGVVDMVSVLEKLIARHTHVTADIVGDRVDYEVFSKVKALAEAFPASVRIHGHLQDADLDRHMRQADIFFAPALFESFGMTYIEAARYALPSVAYAAGGVAEVVSDGEDGSLAPLEDREALFQALEHLVLSHDTRHRMSKRARLSYETKFTEGLMAERLEHLYRDVAMAGGT